MLDIKLDACHINDAMIPLATSTLHMNLKMSSPVRMFSSVGVPIYVTSPDEGFEPYQFIWL